VDAPIASDALRLTFDWNATEKSLTLVDDTVWEASYFDLGENRNTTGNGIAAWSPEGTLAIYRSAENHLSILDPVTKDSVEISDVRVDGYTLEMRWSIQGHIVTIGNANSLRISLYDAEQKTVTLSQTDITPGSEIVIYSPGGRYRSRGWVGQPLRTIDRLNDQPISFPVSSKATVIGQNIRWHPDELWLIKGDASYMTDGNGFRLIGVTNLTGTVWRELSGCYFTPYCVNWLPLQVDVNQLLSGTAESVLPAPSTIDYSVEFSFDDNEADLYDLACDSEKEIVTLVQDEMGSTQYTLRDAISCQSVIRKIHLAVSMDRTLLATVPQYGGRIMLWDAETGILLARLNTEGYGVSFSEDGRKLYTRSWRALLTWEVAKILNNIAF
jgi:hypothetical protein